MTQQINKIHNIVASLVTGPLERQLCKRLSYHFSNYDKASDVTMAAFRDARQAMKDRILHADMKAGDRAIKAARESLIRIIDCYVPKRRDLTFRGCTHEQYAGERTFIEHFKRLYRNPTDEDTIFLEYSDHTDNVRGPQDDEWSTDSLDAFSFDELAEVVEALERGEYNVIAEEQK